MDFLVPHDRWICTRMYARLKICLFLDQLKLERASSMEFVIISTLQLARLAIWDKNSRMHENYWVLIKLLKNDGRLLSGWYFNYLQDWQNWFISVMLQPKNLYWKRGNKSPCYITTSIDFHSTIFGFVTGCEGQIQPQILSLRINLQTEWFPHSSYFCKTVFGNQAISAPSERVFSCASLIISNLRDLSWNLILLVCWKYWLVRRAVEKVVVRFLFNW